MSGTGNDEFNRRVEERVRSRVAEIMASGGVGRTQISQEVLFMLPLGFVKQYERVWLEAYGEGGLGNPLTGIVEAGRLGRAKTEGRHKGVKVGSGSGDAGKAGGQRAWATGIGEKNEKMVRLKKQVDRGLRKLARLMELELAETEKGIEASVVAEVAPIVRCSGCGKIASGDWVYCPGCGLHLTKGE